MDASIRFQAQLSGWKLLFKTNSISFGRSGEFVSLLLDDSNSEAVLEGTDLRLSKVHFYRGQDPSKWQTNVPTYGGLLYRGVFPGIDLTYQFQSGRLKSEYRLAAGADADEIRLHYADAQSMSLKADGSLVVRTRLGTIEEVAPRAYQLVGGEARAVAAEFRLLPDNRVSFQLGPYQTDQPLIIDPEIRFSAAETQIESGIPQGTEEDPELSFIFFGGSGSDQGWGIAVDSEGDLLVAGRTNSEDFPASNSFGGSGSIFLGDGFVTKLRRPTTGTSATGVVVEPDIVWSVYLGGSADDQANDIVVDDQGNSYITGLTLSDDFPVLDAIQGSSGGNGDAFLVKLDPEGVLLSSTYIGGTGEESGESIVQDTAGNLLIAGMTNSSDFQTVDPLQDTAGGSTDGFLFKTDASCDTILYATYLGGSSSDRLMDMALDADDNIYLTGATSSQDFPLSGPFQEQLVGFFDVFVTKIDSDGQSLGYSTFLGGSDRDFGNAIAIDDLNRAYIAGETFSTDFPVSNAFQEEFGGGTILLGDGFLSQLDNSGKALEFSSYFGGSGGDRLLDIVLGRDEFIAAGNSNSQDLSSGAARAESTTPSQADDLRAVWVKKAFDTRPIHVIDTGNTEQGEIGVARVTSDGSSGVISTGSGIDTGNTAQDFFGPQAEIRETKTMPFPDSVIRMDTQPLGSGGSNVAIITLDFGDAPENIFFLTPVDDLDSIVAGWDAIPSSETIEVRFGAGEYPKPSIPIRHPNVTLGSDDGGPVTLEGLAAQGADGLEINDLSFEPPVEADLSALSIEALINFDIEGIDISGGGVSSQIAIPRLVNGAEFSNASGLFRNSHIQSMSGNGSLVVGESSVNFREVTFQDNGALAIDLNGDGVTLNDWLDEDVGANGSQNAPVLAAFQSSLALSPAGRDRPSGTTETTIPGTLHSKPNSDYRIELYYSVRCDASGFGEGENFLTALDVNTDGEGRGEFFAILDEGIPPDHVITSTATGDEGTSEFGPCVGATVLSDPGIFYFPFFQSPVGQFAGYAVSNFSGNVASLELTALNPLGGLGHFPTNPGRRELEPGSQFASVASSLFGMAVVPGLEASNAAAPLARTDVLGISGPFVQEGWIEVATDNPELGSFFQFGNGVTQLDGGVAEQQLLRTFYFTRVFDGPTAYRGQAATTNLSIANPTSIPIDLSLSYFAPQGPAFNQTRTIPARGVLFESVGSLFNRELSGGYIKVDVTRGDGAVGFEQIQLTDVETVLGLNASAGNDQNDSFSAQLASGATFFTNLNLVNTTSITRNLTLTAIDQDGTMLGSVPMSLGPGESFSGDAGEIFGFGDAGAPQGAAALVQASLRVSADGDGVIGDVLFGDPVNFMTGAALKLQTESFTEAVFSQVANGLGLFTGLAFFNPGAETAQLTIQVLDALGEMVGEVMVPLVPGERFSRLIPALIPEAEGQVGGYVRVTSTQPVIGQEFFGTFRLTLLSSVPPTVVQ